MKYVVTVVDSLSTQMTVPSNASSSMAARLEGIRYWIDQCGHDGIKCQVTSLTVKKVGK